VDFFSSRLFPKPSFFLSPVDQEALLAAIRHNQNLFKITSTATNYWHWYVVVLFASDRKAVIDLVLGLTHALHVVLALDSGLAVLAYNLDLPLL
jgi:hypothetical protein